MKGSKVHWVFDPLPPSHSRRGGDPAEHAFPHHIDTFVREVVQNANDQAAGAPRVIFRLRDIAGEDLAHFLEAAGWRTLQPHLAAAAKTRRSLENFLEELESSACMRILVIEDRNTIGLEGDELDGDSHFRALCKDTLYSHKQNELSAGGSYGLGKSVLWSFSSISTVFFNSVLRQNPGNRRSPRFIGRTELPSHGNLGRKQSGGYTGSGWFGEVHGDGGRATHAESLWGKRAAAQAKALYLSRGADSGTSILILGFREPAADVDQDLDRLADSIRQAAVRFFWPAMHMGDESLQVMVDIDGNAEPVFAEDPEFRAFAQCYAQRAHASSRLDEPGDIVSREIDLDIPARRDSARKSVLRCRLTLTVRMPTEDEHGAYLGHVAMFRGPGMVVKYWDRKNVAIGVPAFHATLACGLARNPENPTEADQALEQFLRAAEPPGHDEWKSTPRLREDYEQGAAGALNALKHKVNEALRDLLAPRPRQGQQGPDRLRKLFPIGPRGGKGSEPSAFQFSGLRAMLVDGRWQFSGEVQPKVTGHPWRAVIGLQELGEDGRAVEAIAIGDISVLTKHIDIAIHDGKAELNAPATASSVAFSGMSVTLEASRGWQGELSLEVTGSVSSGDGR